MISIIQQGDAPADGFAHAEHDDGGHQQRHQGLRRAAARIAPAGSGRVGGADHVGREHHRGVVLGDHEGGSDRTDAEAEEQEAFIALRQGHAEHGNRAQQQQAGVGLARAEAVAHRADDQPDQDGDGDGGDVDVGDLRQAQAELALDDRHQRGAGEPGEKAHEEGHPGQVEGAHRRGGEGE
jgi:hypothetical protein